MKSRSIDISIVIVNWKVRDLLQDCLNSVYNTVKKNNFEIIVIDNDSQDGSIEMIEKNYQNVKIIVNHENVGCARASNQGIIISKGEFIVILNPDVILKKNTLDEMAIFLKNHPNAGAVGGKELRPNGTFFWHCRRRKIVPWIEVFKLFGGNRLRDISFLERYFPDEWMRDVPEDQLCKVDILATACMMIRKKIFDTIGLLDEVFWLMSEDIDISMRMGRAGWDIYYLPQASFYHYHGESIKRSKKSIHMIIIGERYALFKKFWGNFTANIYRFAVLISSSLYLTIGILSVVVNPKAVNRRIKAAFDMVSWSIKPIITPKE